MPHNGVTYVGKRGGTRHNTWKASDQVPGTALVNGAVAPDGCPAAATESMPAGTVNVTKPPRMLNGHVNHCYKGKSIKAEPQRTLGKYGSTVSTVTVNSASGRVRRAGDVVGSSVKGPVSLNTVDSLCNSEQKAPQRSLSATAKNWRGRRKFGRKKRTAEVFLLTPPPQEQEDWEKEIQEVTLTDSEKICNGVQPYGPHDVIDFALHDLTLKPTHTVVVPVTANYHPAVHHRSPVQWRCHNKPTEPYQFADADE